MKRLQPVDTVEPGPTAARERGHISGQWHLLDAQPCWMSWITLSCDLSRDLQPGERFWSSLASARLAASGSMSDGYCGDHVEQAAYVGWAVLSADLCVPGARQLDGVLEAQLPWQAAAVRSGPGHQQADQVVGEQVHRQFLFDHGWAAAAEHVHAEGGLDAAQIELDVPAAAVQRIEFGLVDAAGVEQGRYQDAADAGWSVHTRREQRRGLAARAQPVGARRIFVRAASFVAQVSRYTSLLIPCRNENPSRPRPRHLCRASLAAPAMQ